MNPPKLRTGFVSAGAGAAGALVLSTLALLLSIFAFVLSTPCADAGPDIAESTAVARAAERIVRRDIDVMGLSRLPGMRTREIDRISRKFRTKASAPCDKNSQRSNSAISGKSVDAVSVPWTRPRRKSEACAAR